MDTDTTNNHFAPCKSYSQNGEDMLLKAIMWQSLSKDFKGFFVDIGAHHPSRFSNTAYFYEQGWSGINIEPTPDAIALFAQQRERDINLNIGIGPNETTKTLYQFSDSSLNSFDIQTSANDDKYIVTGTVEVDIVPLGKVLDDHLPEGVKIDFMSIDVAGLSTGLLESNNWDKYKPQFLLIEDVDSSGSVDASEVYSFLHGKGYEQSYKTPRTLIFQQKNKPLSDPPR